MHKETVEQIIAALKLAYRKHVCMDDGIGWDELGDVLADALCEAIGDAEFVKWNEENNGTK